MNKGKCNFSDGSTEILVFIKYDKELMFGNLIKADDELPFPALSQLEAYGRGLFVLNNKQA